MKSSSSMVNVDQQRSRHLIKLLYFEFSGLNPIRFFVEKAFVSVTFLEEVLDGKIYFTHVKLTPFHVHSQYSGF